MIKLKQPIVPAVFYCQNPNNKTQKPRTGFLCFMR